jgi:hypothetical protein
MIRAANCGRPPNEASGCLTGETSEVRTSYEVRSGRRTIALQKASTAQEALIEYLRATGCHLDEISKVGAAAVAWRGAVYSAVPAETNP